MFQKKIVRIDFYFAVIYFDLTSVSAATASSTPHSRRLETSSTSSWGVTWRPPVTPHDVSVKCQAWQFQRALTSHASLLKSVTSYWRPDLQSAVPFLNSHLNSYIVPADRNKTQYNPMSHCCTVSYIHL